MYVEGFGDDESWYYLETLNALMPGDYLESLVSQYKASHPNTEYVEGYNYSILQTERHHTTFSIDIIHIIALAGGVVIVTFALFAYLVRTKKHKSQ